MSESQAIHRPQISSGIYKSYSGLLVIVSLLVATSIMGFISYTVDSVILIRAGILSIILAMVLDLFLVKEHILKNRTYVLHHAITGFWACFGLMHAEFIMEYKFGILVYLLLGALFRRLSKISKDLLPSYLTLHWTLRRFMVFFDFCDPVVIWLLWDWVESLPLAHKVFYFGLAGIRLYINAKAYPSITKRLPFLVPKKGLEMRQSS